MRKTHMAGGAAVWLTATAILPVPPLAAVAGVPVAAVVALWPDIDSEQSTAARWLGPVTYRLALWVRRRWDHRGAVHSLLVGVPLCGLLAALAGLGVGLCAVLAVGASMGVLWPLVAVSAGAGLAGAASHPLLDLPTYGCGRCARGLPCPGVHRNPGCAVLWPLVRGRVGVAWILVGSSAETVLVRPLLVVGAVVAAAVTFLS